VISSHHWLLHIEGGEYLRWYLESKDGKLVGKVWALHDSPKNGALIERPGGVCQAMIRWILALALGSLLRRRDGRAVDEGALQLGPLGRCRSEGHHEFITPATRKRAAALVKEGFAVSLSREMDSEKSADNARPFGHIMIAHGPCRTRCLLWTRTR
jgi:hypothetical protein